jgi:gas vesicle protein
MPNIMFILFIILIIVLIIIYHFSRKKEGIIGKINKAIKDVGKFGKDIGDLGKKLGNEISKVKDLGKEIEKIADVPIKMAEDLGNEIANIAKKAENQVTNAFDEVKSFLEGLLDEVWGEIKKIIDEIEKIPKQVEDLATSIFTEYIPDFLETCWDFFYDKVLKPMISFFSKIGGLFENVGDVFETIIKKLLSIPSCVPIYMIEASRAGMKYAYKKFCPGWFREIVDFVNKYIIQLIVIPVFGFFIYITKFVLELLGFNFKLYDYGAVKRKCLDFGPITKIFKIFIGAIQEVIEFITMIFDALNITEIINEIMAIFLGKKKKKSSSISVTKVAKDTIDNVTNTVSKTTQDTLTNAKNMLSSVGIEVPSTNISGALTRIESNVGSLSNIGSLSNVTSLPNVGSLGLKSVFQ